jgi:hypothetical protein
VGQLQVTKRMTQIDLFCRPRLDIPRGHAERLLEYSMWGAALWSFDYQVHSCAWVRAVQAELEEEEVDFARRKTLPSRGEDCVECIEHLCFVEATRLAMMAA